MIDDSQELEAVAAATEAGVVADLARQLAAGTRVETPDGADLVRASVMSAPTYEHRPCPSCGATIGRQAYQPSVCHCGTKLRARMLWRVVCRNCFGTSSGETTRAKAARWAQEHKAATGCDSLLIFTCCDCGWESEYHVVWASADDNARYHRQQEHTP